MTDPIGPRALTNLARTMEEFADVYRAASRRRLALKLRQLRAAGDREGAKGFLIWCRLTDAARDEVHAHLKQQGQ